MTRHKVTRGFLWVLNHTLNRVTMRLAKWGHGPFSLIRHVGRKTGHAYETPVILARVPEGFIAELTYGDTVNWYRNVATAGGCVVLFRGKEYRVTAIEPYDTETGRAAYPAPPLFVWLQEPHYLISSYVLTLRREVSRKITHTSWAISQPNST